MLAEIKIDTTAIAEEYYEKIPNIRDYIIKHLAIAPYLDDVTFEHLMSEVIDQIIDKFEDER